jgi:hypothetical protein
MHVESVHIVGYQQLAGTYELALGLTVVTGANEAGKSALHEALVHSLFGFSSVDRRQRGGSSPKELRRPWSGAPFRAVATLVDRESRLVRVDWDFDLDRVEVRDATTGEGIFSEQPTQRQEFTTGPRLVGLDRADHRQLSCLFQESLSAVSSSDSLRQALQRAVEATAADEHGVEGADEALRGVLSRIGVQSNHYGALATGELKRVERQVEELDRDLVQAHRRREELDELAARQAARTAELERLGARELAVRQTIMRETAEQLTVASSEATRLAAAVTGGIEHQRQAMPADLTGRVASARDMLGDAEDELAAAAAARESHREEVERLHESHRAADAECEALAAYADVSTQAETEVREALGELRGVADAPTPPAPPPPRDELLERFRRGRSEATSVITSAAPRALSPLLITLVAVLTIAGIGAGLAFRPAAFALVLIAAVVLVVGSGRVRPSLPAQPATFEGRSVSELATASAKEDEIWIAHQAALAEHDRLAQLAAARAEHAESSLLEILDGVAPGEGAIEQRAAAYLMQCERQRAWADAWSRVERIASEQRIAMEPSRRHRTASEQRDRAERELRRLLEQVDVRDDDLGAAAEAFELLLGREAEAQGAAERRAGDAGRLDQLLAGRTLDELREEADCAREALAVHEEAHGRLAREDVDERTARELIDERARVAEETADLAARRDEREGALDDPADLELRLHAAREKVAALHRLRDAVRIAREELAASAREAHRRVAPHLNAALARELPRITRGRYREAMVGDDLTIRVVAPETGSVVDVERVSRGTRDQIALVERLELARLLDPSGGGSPLLLDDCFAHTDVHRLPLAVELLAEVAAHRQVVLFSDDPDVVAAVCSADAAAAVIELADPVVEAAATA